MAYNKYLVHYVIGYVMRTTEKSKSEFGNKPGFGERTHFSPIEMNAKVYENQQFVVPWQMLKVKEKKYMVK